MLTPPGEQDTSGCRCTHPAILLGAVGAGLERVAADDDLMLLDVTEDERPSV